MSKSLFPKFSLGRMSLALLVLSFSLTACEMASRRPELQDDDTKNSSSLIGEEVSLKADRSELAELRKEIPKEIQRTNDELALVLQLMHPTQSTPNEAGEDPSRIRERFNKALRLRREKVDKDLRKRRDEFTKTERNSRETFQRTIKKEREDFGKNKPTTEERREFFNEQDRKRSEYFAEERDRRKEFESDINEARKEFDDYVREKQSEFNQEHRAYSTAYLERRRALDLKKKVEAQKRDQARSQAFQTGQNHASPNDTGGSGSGEDPLLEEFRRIPNIPAIHLGPSGN